MMRKSLFSFVSMLLLLLPVLSFARGGENEGPEQHKEQQKKDFKEARDPKQGEGMEIREKNKGERKEERKNSFASGSNLSGKRIDCGEIWKETKEKTKGERDNIKNNRKSFYETHQSLKSFFTNATEIQKTSIKTILETTKEQAKKIQKTGAENYKGTGDAVILEKALQDVVNVWKTTFAALKQYVDSDKSTIYDAWVEDYLVLLVDNKQGRLSNVETRAQAHKDCYDKKTEKTSKKFEEKFNKILEKGGNQKDILLEKVTALIEKLIVQTTASNKPEAWKAERVSLYQSLLLQLNKSVDELTDESLKI